MDGPPLKTATGIALFGLSKRLQSAAVAGVAATCAAFQVHVDKELEWPSFFNFFIIFLSHRSATSKAEPLSSNQASKQSGRQAVMQSGDQAIRRSGTTTVCFRPLRMLRRARRSEDLESATASASIMCDQGSVERLNSRTPPPPNSCRRLRLAGSNPACSFSPGARDQCSGPAQNSLDVQEQARDPSSIALHAAHSATDLFGLAHMEIDANIYRSIYRSIYLSIYQSLEPIASCWLVRRLGCGEEP